MSDWSEEEVKVDYCAGILSIQKVANKYGMGKTTLIDLAKKRRWERKKESVKSPTKAQKKAGQSDQNEPTKKNGRSGGRPSDYLPEVAEDICNLLMSGESLRSICKRPGMPSQSTIYKWLSDSAEFSEQYAHAREAQTDYLADEVITIADDCVPDSAEVAKAKLRIDARKWYVSKVAPKKYGDRIQTENAEKNNRVSAQISFTPEEYQAAREALKRKLNSRD